MRPSPAQRVVRRRSLAAPLPEPLPWPRAFTVAGATEWRNQNGELHRDEGPAVLFADGREEWHQNGKFHRLGGPAVVDADGSLMWYQNGELHRDAGPAIESADGRRVWYDHGKLHRDDGPAIVYPDGREEWYQHGKLHRDGGPAVIEPDGSKAWYELGELKHSQRARPKVTWIRRNGERRTITNPALRLLFILLICFLLFPVGLALHLLLWPFGFVGTVRPESDGKFSLTIDSGSFHFRKRYFSISDPAPK